MASLTEVLATIDARLAALDAERAELVTARAALARIFGAPAPETSQPAPQAGRRARPPVTRGVDASSATRTRVLGQLTRTPTTSTALASALGMTAPGVLRHLKTLEATGQARSSGTRQQTRWSRA